MLVEGQPATLTRDGRFSAAVKLNPGVKVRAVGTGPGDAGSQKIYEKLAAQKNSPAWDTDVAVVHQRGAATMVKEKLLMPYRNDVAAGRLVTRDTAKNALGANVDGFVLPVPEKNVKAYRAMARKAGKIWREHGALEYRECVGDDLDVKMAMPFDMKRMSYGGFTVFVDF